MDHGIDGWTDVSWGGWRDSCLGFGMFSKLLWEAASLICVSCCWSWSSSCRRWKKTVLLTIYCYHDDINFTTMQSHAVFNRNQLSRVQCPHTSPSHFHMGESPGFIAEVELPSRTGGCDQITSIRINYYSVWVYMEPNVWIIISLKLQTE